MILHWSFFKPPPPPFLLLPYYCIGWILKLISGPFALEARNQNGEKIGGRFQGRTVFLIPYLFRGDANFW